MVYKFDQDNNLTAIGEDDGGQLAAGNGSRVKLFDDELRQEFAAFREEQGLSNSQLARQLNVSTTAVSKYLNGKPEGDVKRLEDAIHDRLAVAQLVSEVNEEIQEGEFWKRFQGNLNLITKTRDMGGIVGEAGIGKTISAKLYASKHPTSVYIHATMMRKDRRSIESLLIQNVGTRGWQPNGNQTRAEYVIERFKDSGRLLMVDNAHRLTRNGLAFFFDFHDETGCPVVFIGNPEFLEKIKMNDQMFSRLGLYVDMDFRDAEMLVDHLIDLHMGKAGRCLRKLCLQVVKERGHARALAKQLKLTKEFAERRQGTIEQHFRAAHLHLVRNYKLNS